MAIVGETTWHQMDAFGLLKFTLDEDTRECEAEGDRIKSHSTDATETHTSLHSSHCPSVGGGGDILLSYFSHQWCAQPWHFNFCCYNAVPRPGYRARDDTSHNGPIRSNGWTDGRTDGHRAIGSLSNNPFRMSQCSRPWRMPLRPSEWKRHFRLGSVNSLKNWPAFLFVIQKTILCDFSTSSRSWWKRWCGTFSLILICGMNVRWHRGKNN